MVPGSAGLVVKVTMGQSVDLPNREPLNGEPLNHARLFRVFGRLALCVLRDLL